MNPLGTLRSWTQDAIGTGLLLPPAMMAVTVLVDELRYGRGGAAGLLVGVFWLSALGAVLGSLMGPVGWLAARLTWRTPLLTFAMGPILGAFAGWLFVDLVQRAAGGEPLVPGTQPWWLVLAFGAFAVGPPWVTYVAVRSRGRPGWPVVLATLAWAATAQALGLLWYWMRS